MKATDLHQLLGKQYLITSFIESRLEVVNYIMEGYNNNMPVLMNNRFLHFTAHKFYRSIIIDLYALFGQATTANKYSFRFINEKYRHLLDPACIPQVKKWIREKETIIKEITHLRNKQIAHYNFTDKDSISLNFNHLPQINELFESARLIIIHCGHNWLDEHERTGYDFGREHQYLNSLRRLIDKAVGD